MPPYERLFAPGDAAALMARGWTVGRAPPVRLSSPVDWSFKGEQSRSHNFHLHSLDLIDGLLSAWSDGERDKGYLEAALGVSLDWIARHPDPDAPGQSPMAWYDMAVGVRAYRLAFVHDAAGRIGLASPEALAALAASLESHRAVLARDELFSAHSNHGFFQAAGQLAMARRTPYLPRMDQAHDQGLKRLGAMVRGQFSEEGVHMEHSPHYHRAVLASLQSIRATGLIDDPELSALIELAEEQLGWFIQPNGVLLNFGDTDQRHAEARRPPRDVTWRAFWKSGYFVVREGGAYLAQTLAFHSRVHKHADDLSFVWFDRKRAWLLDAGRYGYRGKSRPGDPLWEEGFWYQDPHRVFVESTHAHNTVEIDGRSYNRRTETPYGSALVFAERTEQGLYVSRGRVRHDDVVHERVLIFSPGRFVLTLDDLAGARPHTFSQWWRLNPRIRAERLGDGGFVGRWRRADSLQVMSLTSAAVAGEVFLGAETPRKQGWVSPREGVLTEAPTLCFEAAGASARFATVTAFGEIAEAPVDAAIEGGRLYGWTVDGVEFRLEVTAGEGEALTVRLVSPVLAPRKRKRKPKPAPAAA